MALFDGIEAKDLEAVTADVECRTGAEAVLAAAFRGCEL